MGKYSRLGKNTLLVFLGNAGSKIIGLAMLPLYTRWLSVEDYGLTDILSVYSTLLISIVSCCIGESLFIFPKNADNNEKREYFSSGMAFLVAMFVFTAIIFFILEKIIYSNSINNSFFDNIWLIYSMVVCMLSQQVIQQFTRSLDKMVVYSITGIVVTLANVFFSILFIPHYGVYGYVLSINFSYICGALYSFFFSRSNKYLNIGSIKLAKCRELLTYSIPLIPNAVMWWLVAALNRPIMEVNVGYDGIGLYAVANKFPGIVTMLFSIFCSSWQISVIEEYGKEGFEYFYNKVFRGVAVLLFTVLIVITLISKMLITVFTTPDFYNAWVYIPILTLGALLSSMSGMSGMVFSAVKKSKYYFYSSIWGAFTAILVNLTMIPLFGILGAAISQVLSFFVMVITRNIFAWKYVRLLNIKKYILMLMVAIAVVSSAFFCSVYYFYILNVILLGLVLFWNFDLKRDMLLVFNKITDFKLKKR